MIKNVRSEFNQQFSEEKYQSFLKELEHAHPGMLDFRVAETPIYIPEDFTQKMLNACDEIMELIGADNFKEITNRSIPEEYNIPGEESKFPECLVFDFGICKNKVGNLEPQLIEMQGFPSLFAYQIFHNEATEKYAQSTEGFDAYMNGYNKESFTQLLKEIIIGDAAKENVILLEIYPEHQKTRIDFAFTKDLLGIETVCLTKLSAEGNKLYYEKDGRKIRINRIYNRVIFDDLAQQKDLPTIVDLKSGYDVEWIPHPNWFYRISKYTLPFIDNPYVPETFFLNEVKEALPLEQYVLKPLFSFAGMGVVIDVQQSDIDNIADPHNWILQRKVDYADVVETPDGPAKAEIRLFYFWKKEWHNPKAVLNLARLSKGKMIGTRYNKDKTWVGGSIALFEK